MENKRSIISNFLITSFGAGLLYLAFIKRSTIVKNIRLICDFRNPLRHQEIKIIETSEDCRDVVSTLRKHCKETKALGLDCEWITVSGTRRPIALLQLASHRGLCALIRLSCFKIFPKELREILEDEAILKVGVAIFEDATLLSRDYAIGVGSVLDLRYLAKVAGYKPMGLGGLSKALLHVELDKDWRIRCSDWEARVLSPKQQEYAAKDALVAVEIFKRLVNNIRPKSFWVNKNRHWEQIMEECHSYIDVKYSSNQVIMQKNNTGGTNINARKATRGMSTLSKKLYDNCLLQAPDGELLCTCDQKKAKWYISQNLGESVSQDPFTVRLNFEPAGRAVGEVGKFYTLAKENRCVVCGRRDAYIRKNVVPREYRRHFPVVMKARTSHDVLLLCPDCHQISSLSDLKVRETLSRICDAPLAGEEGSMKRIEIPRLKQLRSAARALLQNSNKIPKERIEQLKQVVVDYYGSKEINLMLLKDAANVDFVQVIEDYCPHGLKVVNEFIYKLGGLVELEKLWREHFIKTMKPKYLPELWSVTHNAHRLEIRASEGRMKRDDIIVAGLDLIKPSRILQEQDG